MMWEDDRILELESEVARLERELTDARHGTEMADNEFDTNVGIRGVAGH